MKTSNLKPLWYTLALGTICVFLTWYLGHIWVFIIIVSAALIGIAVVSSNKHPTENNNQTDVKKDNKS